MVLTAEEFLACAGRKEEVAVLDAAELADLMVPAEERVAALLVPDVVLRPTTPATLLPADPERTLEAEVLPAPGIEALLLENVVGALPAMRWVVLLAPWVKL